MIEKSISDVLNEADKVCSKSQVAEAITAMAKEVDALIADVESPLFICVMNGGFYTSSRLISQVTKTDLQFDYLHASRYQGGIAGGNLVWEVAPSLSLQGRTVVLVDDIYDEGITIQEIVKSCQAQGAERVIVAVLTLKKHERETGSVKPDVVGLELPDRYVFGCGMDYKNYYRQLDEIYAVKGL